MIQLKKVAEDQSENRIIGVFFIISILLTAFLFFIDEGNYSLDWMRSLGHWVVFAIYAIIIFMGQVVTYKMRLIRNHPKMNRFLSIGLGSAVALGLLFLVIFSK